MQRRRNRGLELGVVLLLGEVIRVGFDNIPPVTLCTIAGQVSISIFFPYTSNPQRILAAPWDMEHVK
jgi:hypothetical protein